MDHAKHQLMDLAEAYGKYKGTQFDKNAFFAAFAPTTPRTDPHIAVIGAKMGTHLFSLVEETMPLPVENLTCASNRSVVAPEDQAEFAALMEAYARQLLGQLPCMRMTDNTARKQLFHAPGLEGVVYHTLQFCDYYGFEYAGLRNHLSVPLLKIESDSTTEPEQLRTRLDAFCRGLRRPERSNDYGQARLFCRHRQRVRHHRRGHPGPGQEHRGQGHPAHRGRGPQRAQRALEQALQQAGLTEKDLTATVTTGYGRGVIQTGDKSVTEITCHAKGAHFLNPAIRSVIDIGGQDSKAIKVEPDGSVSNFVMNDKCAAGTGRFLEMMARTLEISLEDISTIGLKWKEEITISSMCTVFADSEVVSLVAQNKALPDIVHGLNQSVATRAAALFRRIGGAHPCMMTGGVSRNKGVVGAIEEKIGQPLYIHPDAQLCGALGAALFALEMP